MTIADRSPSDAPPLRSRAATRASSLAAPGLGVVEFAALIFLATPLIIFFAGFASVYIGLPAVIVVIIAIRRARPRSLTTGLPTARHIWLCVILAGVFLAVCGYLPPFGRPWDWTKHFAMINELVRNGWPPIDDATQTFLRYPLGYYLGLGLAARLLGERVIEPAVFLETWLGLVLVLLLLLQKIRPSRPARFLVVFLLFGGLDLVGWYFFGVDHALLSTKEWWTGPSYLFAYEGNATLFIWVPQHALPGMLGMLLLISRDSRPAPQIMGLLCAAVLIWSPFAALGLLPFGLMAASRDWRQSFTDLGNILCVVVLVIPLLGYLLASTGDIPHGFTFNEPGFSVRLYCWFIVLEIGLYLVALWFNGWVHLQHPVVVVATLIVLPLCRFGMYNDLVMRASIPSLTLLAIAVASSVTEPGTARKLPLATLIAVGMIGSVVEIIGRGRDGRIPVSQQSLRSGFLRDDRRLFIQYNAPLPNWVLRR